jgi:hypothetical protein
VCNSSIRNSSKQLDGTTWKLKGEKTGNLQSLYVDPLLSMPLHIPAWTVAGVRKQGANTHLSLWLGKIVLGPAVLLVNRVVGLDGHGRKRIAAFPNLVPYRKIIPHIHNAHQQNRGPNNTEEYTFQIVSLPSS